MIKQTLSALFLSILIVPHVMANTLDDSRLKALYEAKVTLETPSPTGKIETPTASFPAEMREIPVYWTTSGSWNACGEKALSTLAAAETEGLDPDDYTPLLDQIKKLDLKDEASRAQAEKLLSIGVLNYISDIKGERLNPRKVAKAVYYRQVEFDETTLLKDLMSQDNKSCAWFDTLPPQHPEYKLLKDELAHLRTLQDWPTLPKGVKLKLDHQSKDVVTLRQQLALQMNKSDLDVTSDTFDQALEDVVKTYQSLHGLTDDGHVGPGTIAALNISRTDRIEQVKVALERHRWLPEKLADRYIQVNIAGYYLKAVDGGKTQFTMPVITGREYRRTPVFTAPMIEIIFNPSWHVPVSIATKDKFPKLRNNPHALGKSFSFYDSSGNRVDPGSVDVTSGGYSIVQSPGPKNALGKIRFTIDNTFSIYLHGTPNQELFAKAKRPFSSGCIRVEEPNKLAEFVFNNPEKWTPEVIAKNTEGTKTRRVKLDTPLPVYITYFTVFEDDEGQTHFVEDLYGQDKTIIQALQDHKRVYSF